MKTARRKLTSKAARPNRMWTPGLRPKAVVGALVSAATLFCLLWSSPSSALGATVQNLHLPTPKDPARVLALEEDRPEIIRAMCSRVKSYLLDSDMPFKAVNVSPAGIQTCWTDQRTTWTRFRDVRSVGIRQMTLKDRDNPVFAVVIRGRERKVLDVIGFDNEKAGRRLVDGLDFLLRRNAPISDALVHLGDDVPLFRSTAHALATLHECLNDFQEKKNIVVQGSRLTWDRLGKDGDLLHGSLVYEKIREVKGGGAVETFEEGRQIRFFMCLVKEAEKNGGYCFFRLDSRERFDRVAAAFEYLRDHGESHVINKASE